MFTNYAYLLASPSCPVQSPRGPAKGTPCPPTWLLLLPPGASCPCSLAVRGDTDHRACPPAPPSGGPAIPRPRPGPHALGQDHTASTGGTLATRTPSEHTEVRAAQRPGPGSRPSAFPPASCRGRDARREGSRPVHVPHRPLGSLDETAAGRQGRMNGLLRAGGDAQDRDKGAEAAAEASLTRMETDRNQLS